MRGRLAFLSSLVALASVAMLGCGGQIILGASDGGAEPVTSVTGSSTGAEAGSADGAPSTGSTTGSSFPECPGEQPKPGYTCTTPNQGCVYKDLQQGTCASWTCTSAHVWVNSTPAGC